MLTFNNVGCTHRETNTFVKYSAIHSECNQCTLPTVDELTIELRDNPWLSAVADVKSAQDLSRASKQAVLEADTGAKAEALLQSLVSVVEGPLMLPMDMRGIDL